MQKAVIFDMDGVLIDSQPLHYQIDMAVLQKCGYPAVLSTVTPFTGVSNPDRWPAYRERLQLKPSVEQLIDWQVELMMQTFQETPLTPIEGIPALLSWLRERGAAIAVASSSSHELIDLVLSRTGIASYFDLRVSGEDVPIGKPAPDIFLHTARLLKLTSDACVVVEDSPSGIRAAKNAHMLCVGYINPHTQGQDLSLADRAVTHYADCSAYLEEIHFFDKAIE